MALNLQILHILYESPFKKYPTVRVLSNLALTLVVRSPLHISNKKGVTSHAVHIGGAKAANNVVHKWKCHFSVRINQGYFKKNHSITEWFLSTSGLGVVLRLLNEICWLRIW